MNSNDKEKLACVVLKAKGMLATNTSQNMTYKKMGEVSNYNGINFHKWAHRTNTPKSVIATFNLLSSLSNEQIIQLIELWRSEDTSLLSSQLSE